jgi:hypothetical protein
MNALAEIGCPLNRALQTAGRLDLGSRPRRACRRGIVVRIVGITLLGLVACCNLSACKSAPKSADGGQEAAQQAAGVERTAAPPAKEATPGDKEAKPAGWDAAAMQAVEQLAGKVRAAGIACDEFEPGAYGLLAADYEGRLSLPAAMGSCTSDNDEDLTFELFSDATHAGEYIDKKRTLLCKQAEKMQLPVFPGFPYVYGEGNAWVVEPDNKETGDKLAKILGGESKMATCTPE